MSRPFRFGVVAPVLTDVACATSFAGSPTGGTRLC